MPDKIDFTPSLLDSHCVIDVRTPLEFDEDHLPGAINIPILSNEERVEIGTIYKQQGSRQARIRGMELTCSRFADMTREAIECAAGRPILVYCWRGGMRSLSMAILLEACGHPVLQLRGGYKAFRTMVTGYFSDFVPPAPLIVIHGMTGSGKTTFINGLDRNNWSVIDLEGLARHRGSAFGSFGLGEQPTQKRFDTLLWETLRHTPGDRPLVLEGESQRIGKITLPGNFYEIMAASCKVWCNVSLDTRVERLTEEYAHREYGEAMLEALGRIRKKLGGVQYSELERMLGEWNIPGLARGLMEMYYDKLYYKNRPWTPDVEIDLEDLQAGESDLRQYWLSRNSGLP
jgi:tRNA 2-selenouridine synthase